MKQTVIDALKNNHTQRINFSLTGTTGLKFNITPNDFTLVAQAIEDGTIAVQSGGVTDGMAKYTAKNDGAAQANTMYVGKNTTSQNILNSLLVHESVHAIFDLKKLSLPWLDNEVIAYIAQGFYVKSAGEDAGLSQEAFLGLEIAKSFQTIGTDPFFLDELKNSLLNNPTYHGYIRGTFTGDG